ncbi:hypothetical protein [Brevundimonas sp.]|uniref:hypothetical protein n=2 Tax=unclassified Brevundimonas TaxID=2622653 RepID=UPI002896CE68|nr:hypothetical protein [Brevundimonas sp.]
MPSQQIETIEADEMSALIRLKNVGLGYELDISAAIERSLLLRMRIAEVAALCKRMSRRATQTQSDDAYRVTVTAENVVSADYKLAKALTKINNRSLTSAEVCEVLGISNLERIRWTKSGRLVSAGKEEIGRSGSVKSDLYRPRDIVAISSDQVEDWRAV